MLRVPPGSPTTGGRGYNAWRCQRSVGRELPATGALQQTVWEAVLSDAIPAGELL